MNNSDMPAMPQSCVDEEYWKDFMGGISGGAPCGLTKREHFAAMAMQGLLANPNIVTYSGTNDKSDRVRDMAVNYADGLLMALESK